MKYLLCLILFSCGSDDKYEAIARAHEIYCKGHLGRASSVKALYANYWLITCNDGCKNKVSDLGNDLLETNCKK